MIIDKDLSFNDAKLLCEELISGKVPTPEISRIIVDLRAKGETADEIAGFAAAIKSKAPEIPFLDSTIDLCGTGGSKLERFNVSTAVAFIVACFGLTIAKHGNKGSQKPNGSFDLLEQLGVPINVSGDCIAESLKRNKLAFIFARKAHPAMNYVAEARKLTPGRTIFNLAGPLSNPTNVTSQVIGTADKSMMKNLYQAASILNRQHITVVFGEPGIDELSISGHCCPVNIG
jgi:anthranilate phosphoribosyltransferase